MTLLIRTVAYKELVRFPPQGSSVDVCVQCSHGPQTIDGPASTGLTIDEPRPGELSPELLGAEQSGGRRTDEASATSVP